MSRNDQAGQRDASDEGFATRWSRLKRETPQEQRAEPAEEITTAGKTHPLTDADMPAIETLNEASDYSGFMSSDVSEPLRRLALRRLFAGAEFNLRDGLDDYDDDFTDFTRLVGIITADMRHRLQQQAKADRTAAQVDEANKSLVNDTGDETGCAEEQPPSEAERAMQAADNATDVAEESQHAANT